MKNIVTLNNLIYNRSYRTYTLKGPFIQVDTLMATTIFSNTVFSRQQVLVDQIIKTLSFAILN